MPDPNLAQYSDPAPTQPLQDGPLSADPIPFEPPQFSAGQRAYLTAPYAQAPAPSPGMYDKFRQALSKVSARRWKKHRRRCGPIAGAPSGVSRCRR